MVKQTCQYSTNRRFIEINVVVRTGHIATVKTLARYMRTDDQEVLDYSSEHYLKRTPKKPYPTMKGIQNLIDMSAPQGGPGQNRQAGAIC